MPNIIDLNDDLQLDVNEHELRRVGGKIGDALGEVKTTGVEVGKAIARKRHAQKLAAAQKTQRKVSPELSRERQEYERIRRSHLATAGQSAAHRAAYRAVMNEDLSDPDHPDCGRFVEEIVESRVETQIQNDVPMAPKTNQKPIMKPKPVRKRNTELCR